MTTSISSPLTPEAYEKVVSQPTQKQEGLFPVSPVKKLVDEYKAREWSDDLIYTDAGDNEITVSGYKPPIPNKDKERLLELVIEHNRVFSQKIEAAKEKDSGIIEKINAPAKTKFFVRADLHSDLASLLAQLTLLQGKGLLDEGYNCAPGFQMIFLGDYMDRGINDIEVMTLLLRLRMQNPSTVHLVRGNHEIIDTQTHYSNESVWLWENKELFSTLYKSFPLALCLGEEKGRQDKKEKVGERQFVHFSHALFNPSVDLEPFLKGSDNLLVVKSQDSLPQRFIEAMKSSKPKKSVAAKLIKNLPKEATKNIEGYLWHDVGATGPTSRGTSGYILSPEDIHKYAQLCGSKKAKLKAFVRGHQHKFREGVVKRKDITKTKVVVSTLAVGSGEGLQKKEFQDQKQQAILFEIAPRVRDWQKTPVFAEGEKKDLKLSFGNFSVPMYQEIGATA